MSALKWRNLSVPQRKALRLLRDRGSAALVGPDISERLAVSLINMGAAVPAGSAAKCRTPVRWISWNTGIVLSEEGREVLRGVQ